MDGSSIRPNPLLATGTAASLSELARALIGAGHRRLALVTPGDTADGEGPFHDLQQLLTAARLPEGRIITPGAAPDALDKAFFTVFRGTHYPTGVLCSDSRMANAAVGSLRALGFRVPEDLTVVWPANSR